MDYGLKVLGRNNKKLFTSKYNTLKGRKSGGGTIHLPFRSAGTDQTVAVNINHNFGFVPFVVAYVESPYKTDTEIYESPTPSLALREAYHTVDKNKLTITYYRFSAKEDLPEVNKKYRYFLFANKII